jgi:ribosomal protein L40E
MKNPVYAVNCKKCRKLLFGLTSLDDNDPNGPLGIVGTPVFQQTSEGSYYLCPHCGAKNMTMSLGGDPPRMKISHAV